MIEIKNLRKSYGQETVVNDVSLSIKKGGVFGFLGQNGAGKTTVMKMIVGLSRPNQGSITVGGRGSADVLMRETIGYMPEAPYFYERLTGWEFLEFCGNLFKNRPPEKEKRYEEILKETGIYDARHKQIAKYSKGMKQRLGFAQALVNDPKYIFLDEPMDGLDPVGRREAKTIIKNLHRRGQTIFFNSHILFDIEELCDEIGVIHQGRLLYSGPVKKFTNGQPLEEKFVEVVENYKKSFSK